MAENPLRLLVIGAHPDDCELKSGGLAAMYRANGHVVKFVSVTNGCAGHQSMLPGPLAERRLAETAAVTELTGIEYEVLDHRDGHLVADLEARFRMIALIRRFQPDLILTHRPNDYHPDHRATATIVCDAAYMVIVPHIVPEVPALRVNPVIGYLSDNFQRPAPFCPTVVIDVEPVLDQILDQMACHESQFFEWLPYTLGQEAGFPTDAAGRRAFLQNFYDGFNGPLADRFRDQILQTYGPERGGKVHHIEAFEGCEYGSPLDEAARKRLFPMLP